MYSTQLMHQYLHRVYHPAICVSYAALAPIVMKGILFNIIKGIEPEEDITAQLPSTEWIFSNRTVPANLFYKRHPDIYHDERYLPYIAIGETADFDGNGHRIISLPLLIYLRFGSVKAAQMYMKHSFEYEDIRKAFLSQDCNTLETIIYNSINQKLDIREIAQEAIHRKGYHIIMNEIGAKIININVIGNNNSVIGIENKITGGSNA